MVLESQYKMKKIKGNFDSTLENCLERIYREIVFAKKSTTEKSESYTTIDLKNPEYTTLFADFGGSTELIDKYDSEFSSWLLKSYLTCVSTIIRQDGGEITAFEGDGLMGIFSGNDKECISVRCAFKIQWAVFNIIQPKIDELFPKHKYKMHQVVGIDSSELIPIKTEVWDNYDILWLGRSANYSARLTSINNPNYSTYITADVYAKLTEELQGNGIDAIWEEMQESILNIKVFRTNKKMPLEE